MIVKAHNSLNKVFQEMSQNDLKEVVKFTQLIDDTIKDFTKITISDMLDFGYPIRKYKNGIKNEDFYLLVYDNKYKIIFSLTETVVLLGVEVI